jgi:hypothetical protein
MISNHWTRALSETMSEEADAAPAMPFPSVRTNAADTFFRLHHSAFSVLFAAIDSAVFADNAAFIARAALQGDETLPKGFDPHRMLSAQPGPHLKRLQAAQSHLLEMIYIRLADNLLNYLNDIIAECLGAQPNLLKGGKDQISVESILSFQTWEELQSHLVERKLIGVAYLGLDKQIDWISANLGVNAMKDLPYYPSVLELVESRNCMVHGRAKVGEKFIKALSPYGVTVARGHLLEPTIDDLFVAARASAEMVLLLDTALRAKFHLYEISEANALSPSE